MDELPRKGMMSLAPNREPAEPGSIEDYNQQQYRCLQSTGINCTAHQFAEWFVAVQGGSLCGDDGVVLDFGDVPDSCLNKPIDLYWDDFVAAKYGPLK